MGKISKRKRGGSRRETAERAVVELRTDLWVVEPGMASLLGMGRQSHEENRRRVNEGR